MLAALSGCARDALRKMLHQHANKLTMTMLIHLSSAGIMFIIIITFILCVSMLTFSNKNKTQANRLMELQIGYNNILTTGLC